MRHSSYLEVNLGLLGENVAKVRSLSGASLIPMVKADAYGNGLVPISQYLNRECGVSTLGCATLGEAIHLLREAPDLSSEVLVFSDTELTHPEHRRYYQDLNLTPVIHQREELDLFLSSAEFKKVPLVLKINTGMNRLGLSLEELEQALPRIKNRGVKHLMTHFACSYYPLKDGDKTHRQMTEFQRAKKLLKDAGVSVEETSVANSGAIEQGFGVDESHVRPGLMLYGPPSVEPRIWDGHQISRFVTKALKLFHVKKGTPVGYGVNVAGEDGFIVVIPVGYGDGLLTFASGATLMVKGHKAKIFGRVNMDMAFLMFDPTAAKDFRLNDEIELWGHDNRVIADLATQMKTIPYQLMCAISNRIPRIYKVRWSR